MEVQGAWTLSKVTQVVKVEAWTDQILNPVAVVVNHGTHATVCLLAHEADCN